jgi:hypothetical protein
MNTSLRHAPFRLRAPRVIAALTALSVVAFAAVPTATPTFAGPMDPVSCNALVQTYFIQTHSTTTYLAYNAVTDAIDAVGTYSEGYMQYDAQNSLGGTGTQYYSNQRYGVGQYPFNPAKTQQQRIAISYNVLDSSGRQLHMNFGVYGGWYTATPMGCLGDNVLYATLPGLYTPATLVTVHFGTPVTPGIPN